MFTLNGQPISIDRPYTSQAGVTYPHLRDPAVRDELGVIEVPDPEQYDQRFYWGVDNPKLLNDREESDEDGNPLWVQVYDPETEQMVNTDQRLVTKGLKSQWIGQVKDAAGKMLATTDWYVIRSAERQVAVPASVSSWRAGVVAEADRLEAAIAACENVEELIEVVGSQNWPVQNS